MNSTQTTAPEATKLRRQKQYFDLESMTEVTLVKTGDFVDPKTPEEALARLGNDSAKFLEIIVEGLRAEAGRALMADENVPFQVSDDEGNLTPFAGTKADPAVVNPLILNLAKMFGYPSGEKGEAARAKKAAAKKKAIELIKNTPEIREGLKNAGAATPAAGSEETEETSE